MTARIIHTKDSDCTVGPDYCCIGCGVAHGHPDDYACPDCGGHGFHLVPGAEGEEPCGWTGEKQKPAKRLTGVEAASDALARALGFPSASDPDYLAACERGSDSGGSNVERDEGYIFTAEDRDLLREIENSRALRTYDALKEYAP